MLSKTLNDMDKLYRAIAVLFILAVSSCTGYDDSDIRGGLSDLENRVSKLETLCSQMNSNIDALQTIVNALRQKEFVESVTPFSDGYTLTFSSGKTVTIYNGKDGKDGSTPQIGVKQHSDGNWYWTVDGGWLYDGNGKMVKAAGVDGASGKDGVTPELKIEDGMWYISYDEGRSWKQLGKATGEDGASAGIISVTEEDGYVRFGMQDGTVISIAKRQPLGISFNKADVAIVSGGMSRTISYQLTGASDDAVVKTISQDGWKAKASQPSQSTGTITITSPDPIVESEVIVLANDGGQIALASINCMKAEIVISNEQYDVSADGGTFSLSVQSNTDFNVSIPEKAKSWLSVVQTKSMSTSAFEISVSANKEAVIRNAVVRIVDDSDNVMRTFFVSQAAYMDGVVSIHVDTEGGLDAALEEASYDKTNIIRMKITGVLNDDDFKTMREEMPELRYLDISDVDMETLPEMCFYRSTNVTTVLLPKNLKSIPYSGLGCFMDSRISGNLVIPSSCTLIGKRAFEGCSALETVSIPSSVQEIGESAFEGCTSLNLVTFVGSDKLQKIGKGAFSGCSSLTTFYMPSTVTEYGDEIFYGCSSLASFTGENAKENGSFIIIDDEVKCYAPGYDWPYVDQWGISMKKIAVPDYVKKDFLAGETEWYQYRENADTIFAPNDVKIKYLSVPGSKTKIYTSLNSQGFVGLDNLLYAYFNCEYLPFGNDRGYDISMAPEWKDNVDYQSGIINPYLFLSGDNLLTVEFGPDVRQIEKCISGSKLVNIHLNEGLKRILSRSLWMLDSLTELKIPDSVEHIGFYCLGHCFNLRKLYFGKGLKYIGEYVLTTIFGAGQNHLQSFYIAAPEPPSGYPIYTINPDCKIYVPAESYDLYLNNDNWSMYASQLYPFDYTDFDFDLAQ